MDKILQLVKSQLFVSAFYKGFSGVALFLSISVLLKFLGTESYGIWILLYTLFQWFLFMDFGISNVLKTKIPQLLIEGDKPAINSYIKSSYAISVVIGGTILLVSVLFILFFDINTALNIAFPVTFTKKLFILNILFFCLNFVLGIHKSLNIGVHKAPLSEQSAVVTQLFFLGAIFLSVTFTIKDSQDRLIMVSLINGIVLSVVNVVYTVIFFKKNGFTVFNTRFLRKKETIGIFRLGNRFMLLQIFMMIIFSSDTYILAHYFSLEETSKYDIVSKYFSFPFMVIVSGMAPLWPMFSKNYAEKNKNWFVETNKKFHLWFIAFCLLVLALATVFKPLLAIFLGHNLEIGLFFVGWFSFLTVVRIYFTYYSYFFNGIGSLQSQLWLMGISAILKIPLSMLLIYYGYGTSSVIIVTGFLLLSWCIILNLLARRKITAF